MAFLSVPEQVAEQIRSDAAARRPGDRLPTIAELAARYGVSKHSVSTAVDILAREGAVTKKHGVGVFVAARSQARVGILSELDLFGEYASPHFRGLAGELTRRLEAKGAEPILYTGHAVAGSGASDEPTCRRFWDDVDAGRIDAAIILDVPCTKAWHERVRACRIHAVGAMTRWTVEPDRRAVAAAAVEQLATAGCRRLGLMSWHNVEPFLEAVEAAGLVTDPAWIRCDLDPAVAGAGWEEFREIWSRRSDRPDGLVIFDDVLFYGAQLAIIEAGVRVPEQLRLAVQVNRGSRIPIRLPAARIELDPAREATLLTDWILRRLQGEAVAPTQQRVPYERVIPAGEPAGAGADAAPARNEN